MTSKDESTELYYAEMEAARNTALDAYFIARPQLARTHAEESIFRAGFERAFAASWNARPAPETGCRTPTRFIWKSTGMHPDPNGSWVSWEDLPALKTGSAHES